MWTADGNPLAARTTPVAGRMGERCAAGKKTCRNHDGHDDWTIHSVHNIHRPVLLAFFKHLAFDAAAWRLTMSYV
jgi:hypothetical protein